MTSSLWTLAPSATYEADQAARVAIFNKIAPAGNWKAAIDAVIEFADLEECRAAAEFFTGGPIWIKERVLDIECTGVLRVRVIGEGYYAHIGA
jgi:hypothetical protein